MGKKDMVTKEYMSKRPFFADAFNACVFGGKQVVNADELSLQEKDPAEIGIILSSFENTDKNSAFLKSFSFRCSDAISLTC